MDAAGLPLLGLVPEDVAVVLSAGNGQLVQDLGKRSAGAAFRNIALRLTGQEIPLMKLR